MKTTTTYPEINAINSVRDCRLALVMGYNNLDSLKPEFQPELRSRLAAIEEEKNRAANEAARKKAEEEEKIAAAKAAEEAEAKKAADEIAQKAARDAKYAARKERGKKKR